MKIKLYISLIISLLLSSCLERFDPEILGSNASVLVVDGLITDETGPYFVKLYQAVSLNEEPMPLEGAGVSIEDSEGPIDFLQETAPGIYQTTFIQGVVGKEYRLNISFDGKSYQSPWELLEKSPSIDNIYFESLELPTRDPDDPQRGVQFYIDSQGEVEDGRFFRYEWMETWQYGVCLPSFYEYFGNDTVRVTTTPLYHCWIDNPSREINVANTSGLSKNLLAQHKLGFIEGDERRFTIQYSLLVKQFAVDEKEHRYWKTLKETTAEQGKLFDKQPARVDGNVKNINNPEDEVVGYFSVTGLQQQRVKVRPRDVDSKLAEKPICYPPCDRTIGIWKQDFGPGPGYDEAVFQSLAEGNFYFRSIFPFGSSQSVGSELAPAECADCRYGGGQPIKPDYWDD